MGLTASAAGLSLAALVGVLVAQKDADTRRDRRGRRADDVAPAHVQLKQRLLPDRPDRARARRRQHGGPHQRAHARRGGLLAAARRAGARGRARGASSACSPAAAGRAPARGSRAAVARVEAAVRVALAEHRAPDRQRRHQHQHGAIIAAPGFSTFAA